MDQPHSPLFPEWHAPAHWQAVDFISDLHLQAADLSTFEVWRRFMQRPVTQRADALCILGDLFEVWVGDDVLQAATLPNPQTEEDRRFWGQCAEILQAYSQHTPVFFMHGNRDFLLGAQTLGFCSMQALADPTVLVFLGKRWLLSHGDALCLDDADYMRFRAMVRQTAWQQAFLQRPLDERETIARELRHQSQARKAHTAEDPTLWADVDGPAARTWLERSSCHTLIHGHTHRPARHDLGGGLQRVVLSDWDLTAQPPRADVLRLDAAGLRREPLTC